MILLTGATGFVGNAVLKKLMQQPDVAVRTYGRRVPVLVNIDSVADARAQMISHVTVRLALRQIMPLLWLMLMWSFIAPRRRM